MLNHEQKFKLIELDYQDADMTLSTASPIQSPETRVNIAKLNKLNLPAPIEAEQIMRSLHWLKYLEEDTGHWYVISQKFEGYPLFGESAAYADPSGLIHSCHLQQFLELVTAYDHLPYCYQYLLLDSCQFLISDNVLVSNEVFDLRRLSDRVNDFDPIRKKFIRIVSHLIAQLIYTEQETYHLVNWTPLYDTSERLVNLSQLSHYWLSELDKIQSRVKPTPLEALYVVEGQSAQTPAAIRRQNEAKQQAELASLQESSKSRPTRLNPAILTTLVIALLMAGIFVLPNLLSQFSKEKPSEKSIAAEQAPTTAQPATPAKTDKPVDPLEKLPISQIELSTDNWTYDTTQFHTGDRSLKLILSDEKPVGRLLQTDISINSNTSLTLWMMSDQAGNANLKVTLFADSKAIHTVDYVAHLDAEKTWYMMNPILSNSEVDLSKVNRMQIEITGAPQTIWIDDLLLESYK